LELEAAMGAPSVVVSLVLGQDQQQMPLAEDQHAVGNFGPGGEHEPFRKSVRARTARRELYGLGSRIGQNCVKRYGELPGPVADKEPEVRGAITQIHQQVANLLCATIGIANSTVGRGESAICSRPTAGGTGKPITHCDNDQAIFVIANGQVLMAANTGPGRG
jgi:hypothetical protein